MERGSNIGRGGGTRLRRGGGSRCGDVEEIVNNTGSQSCKEKCEKLMWARALSSCKRRRGRSGSGSETVLYRGMTHHGMVVSTREREELNVEAQSGI